MERQLGVVRVVCGWFVHFLYKSVFLICVSEIEQGLFTKRSVCFVWDTVPKFIPRNKQILIGSR